MAKNAHHLNNYKMTEDNIIFKLELSTAARKVFSQVMIDQHRVAESMEAGIKKAIDEIDLSEVVAEEAKRLVHKTVQEVLWRGELKELVTKKIQGIVDSIIEKELAHWDNKQL